MTRLGLFAYGSLVSPESAEMTLGRPVPAPRVAELAGWRRRFSQARDNLGCEKTFALPGGERPKWILGLNLERGESDAGPVNGAVIELDEDELERIALREIRYDPVEVTGQVAAAELPGRVVAFAAKAANHAPEPPAGAIILSSYTGAVERAFEALGPGELDRFRATTGPYPVEPVEASLVADAIPEGNPREW